MNFLFSFASCNGILFQTSEIFRLSKGVEYFDIGGIGDPITNNRIDIKRAGRYLVIGYGYLGSFDDREVFWLRLKVNGSYTKNAKANLSDPLSARDVVATVSAVLDLSAGDYLTLNIYQNTGGAVDTYTGSSVEPTLSVQEIR